MPTGRFYMPTGPFFICLQDLLYPHRTFLYAYRTLFICLSEVVNQVELSTANEKPRDNLVDMGSTVT